MAKEKTRKTIVHIDIYKCILEYCFSLLLLCLSCSLVVFLFCCFSLLFCCISLSFLFKHKTVKTQKKGARTPSQSGFFPFYLSVYNPSLRPWGVSRRFRTIRFSHTNQSWLSKSRPFLFFFVSLLFEFFFLPLFLFLCIILYMI